MKLFSWKIKIYSGARSCRDLGGKHLEMNGPFKASVQMGNGSAASICEARTLLQGTFIPRAILSYCTY